VAGHFSPGLFYPRIILSPDPNPKYAEDITILNADTQFGDLWSLFYQPDKISDSWLESGWFRLIFVSDVNLKINYWQNQKTPLFIC
jgi:hypothetical protein